MKRFLVVAAVVFLVLASCDTGTNKPSDAIVDETEVTETPESPETPVIPSLPQVDPSNPVSPTAEEIETDTRLTAFSAAGAWWIRRPTKAREIRFNIPEGDPVAQYCTNPGWAYLFYDDGAVIGYEPFPEDVALMHAAVRITVESHNLEKPSEPWYYINVPPIPPPPPITINDPILGKWQFALCTDDGTIVDGPYTAEFDFEWQAWKESIARLTWELYNRDHDPDAHIVWGTEE